MGTNDDNPKKIDESTKIETLIKLAELQQKGIDKRRDIEWKMSTVLWTAIFVETGFLLEHKEISLTKTEILIFYVAFFLIYLCLSGILGKAHYTDKKYRHKFRNEVLKLIGSTSGKNQSPCYIKWCIWAFDIWILCEILITLLFMITSAYLLITHTNTA